MSSCCNGGKKKRGKKNHSSGKIDSFILTTILITVLIIGGGAIWAFKTSSPKQTQVLESSSANLELSESSHDWGNIPINGGNARKTFEIKNSGSSNLELANFVTSCMCTTVRVITSTSESPEFGMHTKSGWKAIIAPGESAQINVIFDPALHGPQGKGDITRMVKFNTNASGNRQVELRLTGTVI